ncbi:sensor histidine kinase [Sporosarcina sp. 179-K 3D1 HS]|uniref:sensor histidine kinase n=1 Tax=Sporosarcina sp. 179-K 3D1 HS TaxID=3232169 RepID=UPI0039A02BEE
MKRYYQVPAIYLLPVVLSVILFGYFTFLILKYPVTGLGVEKIEDRWIVSNVIKYSWAYNQAIQRGDHVQLVNGETPDHHYTVNRYRSVEKVKTITLASRNGLARTFKVTHTLFNKKAIFYVVLPILFCATSIMLSFFLYRKANNEKSARILSYFLLSIGICYISIFVTARGDVLGRIILLSTLSSSLILFTHFSQKYFQALGKTFINKKTLIGLYILNSMFLVVTIGNQLIHNRFDTKRFVLFFFSMLTIFLLTLLIRFYLKHKKTEGSAVIAILGMTLLFAFGPLVLFSALPISLTGKEWIPIEVTTVFIISIPFAFVYLQLAKKLFDIEFFLSRLRYYSLVAFPYTFMIGALLIILLDMERSLPVILLTFIIVFFCTTVSLYIKEILDYELRHHLFSQKNQFEESLYKFFQKAKYETEVTSLIQNLMNEIRDVLLVKEIQYVELVLKDGESRWRFNNQDHISSAIAEELQREPWETVQTGTLVEVADRTAMVIGGARDTKRMILFGCKKTNARLNVQERIWLETLAYVSSILLENFQLIEGLAKQIEEYKLEHESEENHPLWLSRLLFALSEKERANLSIDLHNTVLQDQLQLLREIDRIIINESNFIIKKELKDVKERMLDMIHLIREACYELRPPFLNEIGMIQSIHHLIGQTKLRCDFLLDDELDPAIQRLDHDLEMTLYRVVQELLNNAMKHSEASEVKLSLRKEGPVLRLQYKDNGIGFDKEAMTNSFKTMGLSGMRERVKSVGGRMSIETEVGAGVEVQIELKVGGTNQSEHINRG